METLFPHLSSTGPSPSHLEVMATYRSSFAALVNKGSLRPLVLPYHMYGCLLLLLYLCIPHTQQPVIYAVRWPVLVVILAFQWKTLWEATSMSMATGFAAGLVAAWGAVWSVTWLVLNRPQFDAKRVNRRKRRGVGRFGVKTGIGKGEEWEEGSGERSGEERGEGEQNNGVTKQGNGSATGYRNGSAELKYRGKAEGITNGKLEKDDGGVEYYWQPYPDNFLDRFTWTSDLLINFRGPGWNWAIPPLPPMPPFITSQLGEEVTARSISGKSSVGLQRYDTRSELARARLPTFIVGYFLLDILKVVMIKDPYYIFGPNTYALPAHLEGYSPLTLQFIRQAISSLSIIVSLEMVFLLAPIFLSLICGSRIFGLRAEPWYYATTWGSWSNITHKGLNGLWGGWWHQTFRFAFTAPSNYLIQNGYVKAGSPTAKFLAFVFAFGISGILHAGGSVSQFPSTYSSHAPIFFMLQALGIVIQMSVCSAGRGVIRKFPAVVRRVGNSAFVFCWLFYTGWWLTDDFARGGIWLYEPIPFSVLRGLGFGAEGEGWWCWGHIGVGWYEGRHWWESGIAI
ncbi:hypothetical protein BKA61DRAFT_622183 [Leptodontidium sp. MPI-SDFR-AT-0119]|nr:hypothetical protein BKA61DRAFT_622183 [Leptodontidium sp. MPI-SDFR-AT-0119]